jgi:UPF0755 protein
LKKLFLLILLALVAAAAAGWHWSSQPVVLYPEGQDAPEFSIKSGSGVRSSAQQIAQAGIPLNPLLFEILVRTTGQGSKLKAGDYEIPSGTTPVELVDMMVRGDYAHRALSIIEGWSFRQMRDAIAAEPALRHDTAQMSDAELMSKINPELKLPEGLFAPDTYLFAKGSSDLQVYKQAHALLLKRLGEAWAKRDPTLPYKTPYDALIMASIVEKETGQKSERAMIAGVFVNRLRVGMLLQTDPTVIYGMGARYKGVIHKSDLTTDTPYNTYTRAGLPPTPTALPGNAALAAALKPAATDALYFVSRGDGSSQFSANLPDHNRAVNRYQR